MCIRLSSLYCTSLLQAVCFKIAPSKRQVIIRYYFTCHCVCADMNSSFFATEPNRPFFFPLHNKTLLCEYWSPAEWQISEKLCFWVNAVLCFSAKEMCGSILSHAGWRASAGLLRRTALFMLLTGACFAHWGRTGRKCCHVHRHNRIVFYKIIFQNCLYLNWKMALTAVKLLLYHH